MSSIFILLRPWSQANVHEIEQFGKSLALRLNWWPCRPYFQSIIITRNQVKNIMLKQMPCVQVFQSVSIFHIFRYILFQGWKRKLKEVNFTRNFPCVFSYFFFISKTLCSFIKENQYLIIILSSNTFKVVLLFPNSEPVSKYFQTHISINLPVSKNKKNINVFISGNI